MALPTFKGRILRNSRSLGGIETFSVEVELDVWDGTQYGPPTPFVLDTGAEVTTVTAETARTLGVSTVGGRAVTLRGATGTGRGLLVPFRFRFAGWPDLEVADTVCAIVPGEKPRGLLGLRDIHPRLEFFKLGEDLFFVPPPTA